MQYLEGKTDWYRYYSEYNFAIQNLIERSDESQSTVLALPVLFLIRHSLELAFKYNIIVLEKMSGCKAIINYSGKSAHVLSKLHIEFERQVNLILKLKSADLFLKKDFRSRNDELKKFRVIFDNLDNWSYAFRYPVKIDGATKSFNKNDVINISEIIPIYEKTQILLKYTVDVLDDLTVNSPNV